MKLPILFYSTLFVLLLYACSEVSAPDYSQIEIEDPWVRSAAVMDMQMGEDASADATRRMGGNTSAAYMILRNNGKEADRLINVKSDAAESVEMHTSHTTNGVTTMEQVDQVEIPAQGKTVLKPGGLHIMLIGLKKDLHPGDKIQLILEFEISAPIQVEAEVRAP